MKVYKPAIGWHEIWILTACALVPIMHLLIAAATLIAKVLIKLCPKDDGRGRHRGRPQTNPSPRFRPMATSSSRPPQHGNTCRGIGQPEDRWCRR